MANREKIEASENNRMESPMEANDMKAMREALEHVEKLAREFAAGNYYVSDFPKMLLNAIQPALAKPPRNCDVYDKESCRMAYHLHGDGIMTMQAFADWLFAPAKEQKGDQL